MSYTSSTVAGGDDALATQYNNLRKDSIENAGDYGTTTGSANAYLLSVDAAITAYAEKQVFKFKANFANTGAATLNVNSIGAVTIKKSGDVDLAAGDIQSGDVCVVVYDGTNMQLITSGIDVFTTTGDMLYKGASSPTRLPIGTAKYILRTNTGATAPEWVAPSRVESYFNSSPSGNYTTEITMDTFTIPANLLEVGDVLQIEYRVIMDNQTGVDVNQSMTVDFGGTEVSSHSVSNVSAGNVGIFQRIITIHITAASAQLYYTSASSTGEQSSQNISSASVSIASTIDVVFNVASNGGASNIEANNFVYSIFKQ